MIEEDPIRSEARERRQRGRLGEHPVCVLCGEREIPALRAVRASLLEGHHIAGKTNDPDATVILCRNDHARITAAQFKAGVRLDAEDERSMPEKLMEVLRGLALLFEALARACESWAWKLAALIEQLDENQPGWRALPAAQS